MSSNFKGTKVPTRNELSEAIASFGVKQRIFLFGLFLVFVIAAAISLWLVNDSFLVSIAKPGGSLYEGVVGTPSFVNPLLATSDADRDLSMLVYSGLMRTAPDGKLIPDLAASYTISDDGKIYTFKLKQGLVWQDGQPITTDDIAYTIGRAQDSITKSAKRANWEGVQVDKLGPYEIRFVLKQPYADFLDNTTLGILPKHLWKDVSSDSFYLSKYNVNSVGSGPYQITDISKDSSGVPTAYTLKPFNKFALGEPKINKLVMRFYPGNEQIRAAYQKGEIESMGAIRPEVAKELADNGTQIISIPLPRIFAVFFNQNQAPVFANKEVRQALDLATDKNKIVKEILKGYGTSTDSALPPGTIGHLGDLGTVYNLSQAKQILSKAGWKMNASGVLAKTISKKKTITLEFSIATSNIPELKATAEMLAAEWGQIGANVHVRLYETGDLNQNVIRSRKFDALLFGEVIGRNPDPFSFWHSSQRNYPGLNIAQYANLKVDKILESARSTSDLESQINKYHQFQQELDKDTPAIFLYSPYFLYVIPNKIHGASFTSLNIPAERFLNIYKWYTTSEKVWPFFANKNNITN